MCSNNKITTRKETKRQELVLALSYRMIWEPSPVLASSYRWFGGPFLTVIRIWWERGLEIFQWRGHIRTGSWRREELGHRDDSVGKVLMEVWGRERPRTHIERLVWFLSQETWRLVVQLAYLVSSRSQRRMVLSQKPRWIEPEEWHLRLPSGPHTCAHMYTNMHTCLHTCKMNKVVSDSRVAEAMVMG